MTDMTYQKPLIGLSLDQEDPGGYSKFPWYALRVNYASCVSDTGGVPIGLPHDVNLVDVYADTIDGLIVTGGNFDVDPALFGASSRHTTVQTKDLRTQFEFDLTRAMLERDKPVLGICGGQQLLNVVLGGSLIQHIPDTIPNALAHEQPNPRDQAGHDVHIKANTQLSQIVQTDTLQVNSAHHQAVDKVAPNMVVNAVAPDGVIEGIEDPTYRFCIGVQWHPEFFISDGDRAILSAFVKAAETH